MGVAVIECCIMMVHFSLCFIKNLWGSGAGGLDLGWGIPVSTPRMKPCLLNRPKRRLNYRTFLMDLKKQQHGLDAFIKTDPAFASE